MKMAGVWMMVLMMAVLMVFMKGTVAQFPPCAMKLANCANYLNATKPPSSCCVPLKDSLTHDFACLCNLYNTPGLLASFGINASEIEALPGRCKIDRDITDCKKALSPSPSPAPSSTPSTLPSSTPGTPKNEGNSLMGISWAAASCSLFLIWVMLN